MPAAGVAARRSRHGGPLPRRLLSPRASRSARSSCSWTAGRTRPDGLAHAAARPVPGAPAELANSYRSGFWAHRADRAARARRQRSSGRRGAARERRARGRSARRDRGGRGAAPARPPRARAGLIAICMATFEPDMELFRAQIDSLRAQTDERWICVISDDCSRAGALRARSRRGRRATRASCVSRSERAARASTATSSGRSAWRPPRRSWSRSATRTTAGIPTSSRRCAARSATPSSSTPTSGSWTATAACCARRCGRAAATTTPTSPRSWSPTRSPAPRRCSAARSPSWRCRSPRRPAGSSTTTGSGSWRSPRRRGLRRPPALRLRPARRARCVGQAAGATRASAGRLAARRGLARGATSTATCRARVQARDAAREVRATGSRARKRRALRRFVAARPHRARRSPGWRRGRCAASPAAARRSAPRPSWPRASSGGTSSRAARPGAASARTARRTTRRCPPLDAGTLGQRPARALARRRLSRGWLALTCRRGDGRARPDPCQRAHRS